jgi:hypothetical protein
MQLTPRATAHCSSGDKFVARNVLLYQSNVLTKIEVAQAVFQLATVLVRLLEIADTTGESATCTILVSGPLYVEPLRRSHRHYCHSDLEASLKFYRRRYSSTAR